jgi:hypothetical protein
MPRAKKHPKDWTTEEAMKKLFPKKVREELIEEAKARSPEPQVKPLKPSE